MTQPIDPNVPEPWQQELQTRHPGIADEIEGAIHTLQKLQQITGTVGSEHPAVRPPRLADPSATVDVPGEPLADTDNTAEVSATPVRPHAAREVPILAASESFGRYQIVRVLGKGAMGAVYLAYDSQLERYVALKTPFLGDKPDVISRFYREARAAAQIRSPYVCPIYDVGQISDVSYLSMAFIDGQSLQRAIGDGRLKEHKVIADIVQKIARGLQKAHELGIIHRDLKPENIMLDPDGDPIVMDFGVARRVDDTVHLTTPGRLVGTPSYMSPEQVDADPAKIGPATDIYSLGVMLYVMLAGRLPFRGSLISVLRQIGQDEPPKPSALNPAIGESLPLERICLKMMAKSAADRFASMAEVAKALEQAFPREAAPTAASPSRWRSRWSWLLGLFRSRTPTQTADPAAAAQDSARPSIAAVPARSDEHTIPTVDSAPHPDAAPPQPRSDERTIATADGSGPPPQAPSDERTIDTDQPELS